MKTPIKNSFKLSKVKIKSGVLDCHFEVEEQLGQEIYSEKYHTESTKDVHPDLSACFNNLRPIMARVYHLTFFRELMKNEQFDPTPEQAEIAEKMYQELLAKIDITGVAISGQDQNEGVVLTGTFKADTNQKMAINSHRIKFTDTKYGFEEDLEVTIDEIKDEVYAFLFEGKRAQLSLFGEDTGTSEEEETPFDGKAAAAGAEKDDFEEYEEEEPEEQEEPEQEEPEAEEEQD